MSFGTVRDVPGTVRRALNRGVESAWFLALWVAFSFLNSICGFEWQYYITAGVIILYIILFSEKFYPLYGVISVFYFTASRQNNPGQNPDSFFYPENGLTFLIVMIAVLSVLAIIRIVLVCRKDPYLPKLTVGFALFGAALMLGGLGSGEYSEKTVLYGFVVFVSVAFFYLLGILPMRKEKIPPDYFFQICFFCAINLALQVVYVYLTQPVIAEETLTIKRQLIWFGWGHYNNLGGMMLTFLPAAMYLSVKPKVGWLYYLGCLGCYLTLFANQSRQAIVIGSVMFAVGSVLAAVFGKANSRVAVVLTFCALGYMFWHFRQIDGSYLNKLIADLMNIEETGESRINIYKRFWELFKEHRAFGAGFYASDTFKWGTVDASFIPPRAHNTVFQLLGSCGIVGLGAYLIHRAQTLWITFRKPTVRKFFLFFGIAGLLLASLVDCHFFNIGPGLTYSMMLGMIELENFREKRVIAA